MYIVKVGHELHTTPSGLHYQGRNLDEWMSMHKAADSALTYFCYGTLGQLLKFNIMSITNITDFLLFFLNQKSKTIWSEMFLVYDSVWICVNVCEYVWTCAISYPMVYSVILCQWVT